MRHKVVIVTRIRICELVRRCVRSRRVWESLGVPSRGAASPIQTQDCQEPPKKKAKGTAKRLFVSFTVDRERICQGVVPKNTQKSTSTLGGLCV